jgi:hypothetical protein
MIIFDGNMLWGVAMYTRFALCILHGIKEISRIWQLIIGDENSHVQA